jgi:hypothetical protein
VHWLVTKNFDIYRNARCYNNKNNRGISFEIRDYRKPVPNSTYRAHVLKVEFAPQITIHIYSPIQDLLAFVIDKVTLKARNN